MYTSVATRFATVALFPAWGLPHPIEEHTGSSHCQTESEGGEQRVIGPRVNLRFAAYAYSQCDCYLRLNTVNPHTRKHRRFMAALYESAQSEVSSSPCSNRFQTRWDKWAWNVYKHWTTHNVSVKDKSVCLRSYNTQSCFIFITINDNW